MGNAICAVLISLLILASVDARRLQQNAKTSTQGPAAKVSTAVSHRTLTVTAPSVSPPRQAALCHCRYTGQYMSQRAVEGSRFLRASLHCREWLGEQLQLHVASASGVARRVQCYAQYHVNTSRFLSIWLAAAHW